MKKITTILIALLLTCQAVFAAQASKIPDKKTVEKYVRAGLYYKAKNDFTNAYKYFYAALRADGKNMDSMLGMADCLLNFKKYDAAMNLYKRYVNARPNDAKARESMASCGRLMANELNDIMPPAEDPSFVYKSPAAALMYSHMDALPFLNFFPVLGLSYAFTREENKNDFKWQLIPSFAGDACFVSALTFILLNQGSNSNFADLSLISLEAGLSLCGVSAALDAAMSPFKASENAVKFINYNRAGGFFTPSAEKLEYREPILVSALSFIIPGGGFFYAGNSGQGFINLGVGIGLDAAAFVVGYWQGGGFTNDNPGSDSPRNSGLGWLSTINLIFRLFEVYNAADYTDSINREYFKQLVCRNSPFKAAQDKDAKSPMLAFILAAGPGLIVPGLGNFYAENWQAGFTLAAERVAALALAAMNLNADPKNALGQTLKYTGITFAVITYLYDVLTAPGYADIYNAVYVKNKSGEQGKVNLIPSLMKDGAGLNVAYSF